MWVICLPMESRKNYRPFPFSPFKGWNEWGFGALWSSFKIIESIPIFLAIPVKYSWSCLGVSMYVSRDGIVE